VYSFVGEEAVNVGTGASGASESSRSGSCCGAGCTTRHVGETNNHCRIMRGSDVSELWRVG